MKNRLGKIFLLGAVILFTRSTPAFAQPSNANCESAFFIPLNNSWCSAEEAFTNVDAGGSSITGASCFVNNSHDVWFTFFATATTLNVTVAGNTGPSGGGTLDQPEVALYTGACNNSTLIECQTDADMNNIIELFNGSMTVGQQYWLRIDGRQDNQGNFQLCVSSFNPEVAPESDCINAAILCNKSPFTVGLVTGPGNDPDEAGETSCLGGLGGNSESNSSWFAWTAANSGTLTFSITPTNQTDDLDFVVFELPGGIQNCEDKVEVRCMAAGDFNFPSPCMGPTGLNSTSQDTVEPPGCGSGNDNWLQQLDMVQGTSYALMVNNFTSTGNGFSISFGGTGEFLGPDVDFTIDPPVINPGQSVTITDNSSFPNGTITGWQWNFGVGAVPQTANTQGPHTVTYNTPCTKQISLTVTTDNGCEVTVVKLLEVTTAMNLALNSSSSSGENGTASVIATGGAIPYTYLWSDGQTTPQATGLSPGDYSVWVFDAVTCMLQGETTVEMITSTELLITGFRFDLYPNPANDQVIIDIEFDESHEITLMVNDILGRVVGRREIQSSDPVFAMDVSDWPAGIYFVTVNDGRQSEVKEFVKIR